MKALRHPLRLATVSRDTLGNRNVVCRKREPMQARWLGQDWLFDIGPATAVAECSTYVECDWGGARMHVGVGSAALQRLAAAALPGDEPAHWPVAVQLAALEYALSDLACVLEQATRRSLRLVAIGERPRDVALEAYGWRAVSGEGEFGGPLLADPAAARFLATALRDHPVAANDADWDALPLRMRLVVGWVDLSAGTLRGLARHDVVVLDECLVSADDRLVVLLGPRLGLPCALRGSELHVLEGVQEIMADVDDSVAAASGLIDDVPVRLTFDLGEREISLGDLRTLQPGYLFNLGRDPRSTVSIRANGRLIGDGELVDIEGRVGVSVLHFNLDAQ